MSISADDPCFDELNAKLNHKFDMLEHHITHKITWGVHCGPTIEMVPNDPPLSTFERYLRGDV